MLTREPRCGGRPLTPGAGAGGRGAGASATGCFAAALPGPPAAVFAGLRGGAAGAAFGTGRACRTAIWAVVRGRRDTGEVMASFSPRSR